MDRAGDTLEVTDAASVAAALAGERDQLAAEKADLQDRLRRRTADFENFRKRSEKDLAERREYASEDAIRNLLPILDDFELALRAPCADAEYAKGMQLIYGRFADSMKRIGLEPMEVVGAKFDPARPVVAGISPLPGARARKTGSSRSTVACGPPIIRQ